MTLSVAIVGSGPAGFYAADSLLKKLPDCRIDIIERLPTPFGLVRSGVAPDHQSTKNVTRVFEKVLDKPTVRFVGNIELGRDLGYDELKAAYDIVILALGAQAPRRLGIPGEDLAGVCDVVDFVGWYNAVPGAPDCGHYLDARQAIVVGNGNVAIDIARLLARSAAELAQSDVAPAAERALLAAPITDIYLVGRRGALDANFTFQELAELGEMERAVPLIDPGDLPAADQVQGLDKKPARNLEVLRGFAGNDPNAKPVRIHLCFRAAPAAVLGKSRMTGVRFARTRVDQSKAVPTGETFDVDAQLLVPAIGYRVAPVAGLPIDQQGGIVANRDGLVEPGVYVVGWAKRGPSGVIGTNRNDSGEVVDRIIAANLKATKPGADALDRIVAKRRLRPVATADWRRIDQAERAAGNARPRRKIERVQDMIDLLESAPA